MAMRVVRRRPGVLKLVHPGGYVELHRKPVLAVQVLIKNPRHCVTRPDVFKFPWIVVRPESLLELGYVFYIVPHHTIYRLLRACVPPYFSSERGCHIGDDGYQYHHYYDHHRHNHHQQEHLAFEFSRSFPWVEVLPQSTGGGLLVNSSVEQFPFPHEASNAYEYDHNGSDDSYEDGHNESNNSNNINYSNNNTLATLIKWDRVEDISTADMFTLKSCLRSQKDKRSPKLRDRKVSFVIPEGDGKNQGRKQRAGRSKVSQFIKC